MAPTRVICDSDDDGGDFSPIKDPVGIDTTPLGQAVLNAPDQPGTESTDLSFFRSVYEEQGNGTIEVPVSASNRLVYTKSSGSEPAGREAGTNSSSITDPVLARRQMAKSSAGDFVNLTQVTTPRNKDPKEPPDVWDFPGSPETAVRSGGNDDAIDKATKSTVAEAYRKRKRRQQAIPQEMGAPESPRIE